MWGPHDGNDVHTTQVSQVNAIYIDMIYPKKANPPQAQAQAQANLS